MRRGLKIMNSVLATFKESLFAQSHVNIDFRSEFTFFRDVIGKKWWRHNDVKNGLGLWPAIRKFLKTILTRNSIVGQNGQALFWPAMLLRVRMVKPILTRKFIENILTRNSLAGHNVLRTFWPATILRVTMYWKHSDPQVIPRAQKWYIHTRGITLIISNFLLFSRISRKNPPSLNKNSNCLKTVNGSDKKLCK